MVKKVRLLSGCHAFRLLECCLSGFCLGFDGLVCLLSSTAQCHFSQYVTQLSYFYIQMKSFTPLLSCICITTHVRVLASLELKARRLYCKCASPLVKFLLVRFLPQNICNTIWALATLKHTDLVLYTLQMCVTIAGQLPVTNHLHHRLGSGHPQA